MADVIAMVAVVIATFFLWLMLLPQWLMLLPLNTFVLADVIAMVADVITTQGDWGALADVKAKLWLMLLPLVSIYFRFSSEMFTYHQGLSESYKNICRKYGIDFHLKGGHTIKDHLMASKDKDPLLKKSGVIYRYKCDRVDCEDEYIGESAGNFEERYKEHLKALSPIHDHCNTSGHNVNIDNFTILGREDHSLLRTIKEALYIRVNNPSLNRNIGKYHLPHIWDEVLLNISELNLK